MAYAITEQEVMMGLQTAITGGQIYAVYQPQYNHATGKIVGAEALMRWKHPVYGDLLPYDFIPVLESTGLIYEADLCIFETVCKFQKKCLDEGIKTVPISFNVSRFDFYQRDYAEAMEAIRTKYEVPVDYLRVEITESSAIGGVELVKKFLDKLHSYGYIVEMDDFGSGYSSLNVLKGLPVDVLKLDMEFLSDNAADRGGIIVSAIIQMAKWLKLITIAEGVETAAQADFLLSLGCNYVQGYFYSRPVPDAELVTMLQKNATESMKPAMDFMKLLDMSKFWTPDSLETIVFNNYVGAAVIFSYSKTGSLRFLRANSKYFNEIGIMDRVHSRFKNDTWSIFTEEGRRIFEATIKKAIETREEATCETWRFIDSGCCGDDKICIRSSMRLIGLAEDEYIMYAIVQDVTLEKKHMAELAQGNVLFSHAIENERVYAWEFEFATKNMRPCFRCMRDMGLPALVKNYPDTAIEMGIFQREDSVRYHAMLKSLEDGAETAEDIYALTVGKVPFRVRYTTVFDENGKPVKAYGSAVMV